MKKKRVGKTNVILFGLCAIIWSAKAVYEIITTPYPTTPTLLILDVVCALCWIVAFAVSLKRYRSDKGEQ